MAIGPITHLVAQPGDFENLDRLPAEQPASVLVEQFSVNARCLELAQVLLREPSVGRKQEDAVQLAPTAMPGQVRAGTAGCWRASAASCRCRWPSRRRVC